MGVNCKPKTYTEIFEECFPYYLSIGMTYELFWEGDVTLPKLYRKAEKMRQEQQLNDINFKAWLQGRYIYDALIFASPLMRTSFGKGIVKAHEYHNKPIEMTGVDSLKTKEEIEQEKKNQLLKVQLMMSNLVQTYKHLPQG